MPSKKKKYNARFPAGRIKKIMQTDEEVGKVAQAVPVIISRTLELFVESLLTKSMQITQARNAKTLTPSHMKQCILSESRFDFLKDLVKDIPDASSQDDSENASSEVLDYTVPKNIEEAPSPPNALKIEVVKAEQQQQQPEEIVANFYTEQSTSASRTPVIQYGPKLLKTDPSKLSFSVENLVKPTPLEPKIHLDLSHLNNISSSESIPAVPPLPVPELVQSTKSNKTHSPSSNNNSSNKESASDNIPPLVPISRSYYGPNTGGNLYIDEDYDN